MTDSAQGNAISLPEDDVMQAKIRLDRIRAIANSVATVDRNGYTDELFNGTILNLMNTIDDLVEEGKQFLAY